VRREYRDHRSRERSNFELERKGPKEEGPTRAQQKQKVVEVEVEEEEKKKHKKDPRSI
jgi:hypothetical protein